LIFYNDDIKFKNGETAIHYSCRCSNVDEARHVIDYLIKNNVSLNVQNKHGETALHIAARYGCTDLIRYMCEFGANLDIQDDVTTLNNYYFLKKKTKNIKNLKKKKSNMKQLY